MKYKVENLKELAQAKIKVLQASIEEEKILYLEKLKAYEEECHECPRKFKEAVAEWEPEKGPAPQFYLPRKPELHINVWRHKIEWLESFIRHLDLCATNSVELRAGCFGKETIDLLF